MACEHLVTMRTAEGLVKCAACNATVIAPLATPPIAPLATPPVDTREETLRGLGYHDLRAFIVMRGALLERERKMLTALSKQLDDAAAQHGFEALERFMNQARHIREEVLKLRNERTEKTAALPDTAPLCRRCVGTGTDGYGPCIACKGTGRT